MNTAPAPEPFYLDESTEAAFITFHAAAPAAARDTAMILCPPFGWEEVCAYRSLRAWAFRLAEQGYATVRLSFPSTGDSAGDALDPDRLGAWVASVQSGAGWLHRQTGAGRVAAIGLGLGGLVSLLAVAAGAPIDDLALWGTPGRGRAIVRQLRALSRLEASRFYEGLELPPPLPEGQLEAGGFLLSAETVGQLEAVDLTGLELPPGAGRRALLLERDSMAVDANLREPLQSAGVAVTVDAGKGYGDMTSHPQQARPAWAVLARVLAWLEPVSAPAPSAATAPPPAAGAVRSIEIRRAGAAAIRETPIAIEQPFGRLAAVLVEPLQASQHGLCAVLLNAGAVRRTGPSRMWTEAARRWAQRGVPTLRLDVEGIGDSDGDGDPYSSDSALYVSTLVPQVISALDFLQAREVGERFVLAGLCAGAYWSFHAALSEPRVCAALMLNPRRLFWDAGLGPARDLRALLTEPFSPARLRRAATAQRRRALSRWLVGAPGRGIRRLASPEPVPATERQLDQALDLLGTSGKRALLLFSEHEPFHDELVRSGRAARIAAYPNINFAHIGVRDHTMRPNRAQAQLHAALDRALDRELELAQPRPTT